MINTALCRLLLAAVVSTCILLPLPVAHAEEMHATENLGTFDPKVAYVLGQATAKLGELGIPTLKFKEVVVVGQSGELDVLFLAWPGYKLKSVYVQFDKRSLTLLKVERARGVGICADCETDTLFSSK